MMQSQELSFWKKAPFVRLFIPLAAGVYAQFNFSFREYVPWLTLATGLSMLILFSFLPVFKRFRWSLVSGVGASFIFFSLGALLTFNKDVRNHKGWIGHQSREEHLVLARLSEEPVEKPNSIKSIASLEWLTSNPKSQPLDGKINIYFKKDTLSKRLEAGSTVIFYKPVLPIRNSGNPGAFDFKRFSLFHGITHQLYLDSNEYFILPEKRENFYNRLINTLRNKILILLRRNIHAEKELGLAEALLIGYKDDLDPALVQSYANTGVVHIIAISGLHVGLIYWLLLLLFKPMGNKKKLKFIKPLFIISILWVFSFLAGAQPSILRSALMFSCMVLGDSLGKRHSIYNTLAFSAFLLLCINPFWLWDLGFQLSYSAILGILVFMRPIYRLLDFRNKMIDHVWKAISVTLAAQLLSLPFCIYYFHQFPNYFLISNLVAVPLSSLLLLGEILLCALSFIPAIAVFIGKLVAWAIGILNGFIERMDRLPFSRWEDLQVSAVQAIILFFIIIAGASWAKHRSVSALRICLLSIFLFLGIRSFSLFNSKRQSMIIVYDIPHHRAVDIIEGNKCVFFGDPFLEQDEIMQKYDFRPSRLLFRVNNPGLRHDSAYISFANRHIFFLDKAFSLAQPVQKPVIDLLVVSGHSTLKIPDLAAAVTIRKFIFDSSVPPWKLKQWKRDCDSLGVPFHDVSEKGAFVMSLR